MEAKHIICFRAEKNSAREIAWVTKQLGIGCWNSSFGSDVDFPSAYQSEHSGRFYILIPEVREDSLILGG